ncbi:hypothetical protein GGH19_003940 [Coemansia sp. RSA 1807]|nr:hypothetical protein GGF48_001265 [Coemansia sp. RSA 921]KAJ2574262.1 hypothetical protein GGH19_003940 [Coemansia sp. RSA 1807]
MNGERMARAPTSADTAWATQQIATIVGATPEDAQPLAEFLLGIDDANEVQGQLLDMLGESPMALDFAFAFIARRFPVEEATPALPPRSQVETPSVDETQSQVETPSVETQSQVDTSTSTDPVDPNTKPLPEYKSQRQIKRERQEKARRDKSEAEKQRQRALRKRVKCECQASEHPLITNCLKCGRIICDNEGPGPCMCCGNNVDGPSQQLEQYMQSQALASDGAHVLSNDEYMALAFEALKIDKHTASAQMMREAESWVTATKRKERLLGFDRTAAQRTRLIDQSSDFDPNAIDKWMSPEEKAQMEKLQSEQRARDQEREARLKRGMRVLRLNFKTAEVDIRPEAEESEPKIEPKAPVAQKPAAQKPVKDREGAFAHNPLLTQTNEPKFVMGSKPGSKKTRKAQPTDPVHDPQHTDIARQRQMLRIQSDMTDVLF